MLVDIQNCKTEIGGSFPFRNQRMCVDTLAVLPYGTLWCGVVWCGMVWYGVVWYGVV